MSDYYVKASGSNTSPFNSLATAAPTLNDLLLGIAPTISDIIYIVGTITEPAGANDYYFNQATLQGTDSRTDKIYLSNNYLDTCTLKKLGIWTDREDGSGEMIYEPDEVSDCRVWFTGTSLQSTTPIYSFYSSPKIVNNLFYGFASNSTTDSIWIEPKDSLDHIIFVNNTLVNCTGVYIHVKDSGWTGVINKLYVFNNIIVNGIALSPIGLVIKIELSVASSIADFQHDHNCAFGTVAYVYTTEVMPSGPVIPFSPDVTEIVADPLFVGSGPEIYQLQSGSTCKATGTTKPDTPVTDLIGTIRPSPPSMGAFDVENITIGAFEFISGTPEDAYVEGTGDDYLNFGGKEDPFRTLDKSLLVSDATTHIDGGHYDTYYLQLHNQYLDLNQLFIYTPKIEHLVSYKTLLPDNIKKGYYYLPGFLTNPEDSSNVAMNVVGGPTQVYGFDYKVETGAVVWKGMNLDGFLAVGDTLRILYGGQLQYKALNTLTFHSHYSNLERERAIFVAPGGSDSTVLGGDGTNTGGTGSFDLPYRTIDKALSISIPGDNIVAIAGEYPIFQPLNDRVLVTATDQTVVTNGQQFLEDNFSPNDFRAFGTSLTGPIPWTFTYSGSSYITSGGGFLSLTYDGSNLARADSIFQLDGSNFDVQATLIDFVDPLQMQITGPDATFFVNYYNQDYTCGSTTAGRTYSCSGTVDYVALPGLTFITDYVSVTYENIENQYIPLAFLPADCSNIAVNVVGGTSQNFGEDFIIQNGNLTWDSSSNLADLDAGEILRIIYGLGNNTFAPIRAEMNLTGNRFTTRLFSQGTWQTAYRRDVGNSAGPWTVSFVMDSTGDSTATCLNGRGFVSGFVAIADSITNSDIARPYGNITERKNLVLFADKSLCFVTDSSLRTGYDGTRYRNRIDATGGTSDWAWPYTWSWQVTDGIVPPGVLFYDKQSYAWLDGTPTAPGDYTFTVQLNDPGSRDQNVSKEFFLTIT